MTTSRAGDLSGDGFQQYEGLWAGRSGYFTIELKIAADGSFHWISEVGNARGVGKGHLNRKGDTIEIDLHFIQKEPLRMVLGEDSKSLGLFGEGDKEIVLFRE